MSIAAVDTFEKNIAEEIKRKDATYNEIVTATNEIGNTPPEVKNNSPIYILVSVLVLFAVIGIGVMGYLYQSGQIDPFAQAPAVQEAKKQQALAPPTSQLLSLSLTLDKEIGSYVSAVQKTPNGYIIKINNYSSVFSYITRNEQSYIQELAEKVYIPNKAPQLTKATTTQTIPIAATSSATSTTQIKTSTTTPVVSTTTVTAELSNDPYFTNITLNNQNMRIWNYASGTVVYAFINTQTLAVSSSTNGILMLKNQSLQK